MAARALASMCIHHLCDTLACACARLCAFGYSACRLVTICRAKQRRRRLEVLEQQLEQQQAGGSSAPAEPRFGEDTSEESEGEVSHFRVRQGEVQEAADAGGMPRGLAGGAS